MDQHALGWLQHQWTSKQGAGLHANARVDSSCGSNVPEPSYRPEASIGKVIKERKLTSERAAFASTGIYKDTILRYSAATREGEPLGWVLCLLIPLLSVGGLSSAAASGLRLSSSIVVDGCAYDDPRSVTNEGIAKNLSFRSARGQCTRAPAQIGAFFSLACAFVPHSFKSKEAPSVRDRDGALAWLAAGELSLDKRLLLVPFSVASLMVRTEYIAGTPGSLWGMGKEDQIELEPERKKKYC
ncbi:hypothetical protein V6N12_075866 [Hibiscus sabdariffa]|uniref:Uncharacterized protein n=1 Tax=Hibiscus sabdariffa TaxID=183260 RepID=A0ABR2BEG7_9ROSI